MSDMTEKMAAIVVAEQAKDTPAAAIVEEPKPIVQSEKADDDPGPVDVETDQDDLDDDSDDTGAANADDDADGDDTPDESAPSAAMVSALKKYGVDLDLTDIPAPARAPLMKKIAAMEAGYTKAMQEARSYRAEKAAYEAAKTYETASPEKHIADLLDKDPALSEKVNAEIDKRANPVYREALDLQRQTATDKAALDAQAQAQQQADRDAQVESLNLYVVSAVKHAKVPMSLVEDAIVRADTAKYNAGNGFLTEAEIDAIVKAKADVYRRGVSGAKGAERRKLVADKVGDRQTHKNTTKPSGSGVTPAPAADLSKLSTQERMVATLAAMGVA